MRRLGLLLCTLLAAAVLAACGDDSSSDGTAGASDHNAADVTFAQNMIAHHQHALDMADLAIARASSPEVKALAEKVRSSYTPEINTMTGWLTTWGLPTAPPGGMPSHDMSGASAMPMPSHYGAGGMMNMEDMATLMAASGREFDQMYLQMMIEYHQGATAMATAEERDGLYGPAKQLATTIRTSQTAEITTTEELLAKI